MPRIVVISDTHGLHKKMAKIPPGDILIHAGDLTGRGRLDQLAETADFLRALPHPYKVVIAGNHDFCLEEAPQQARALLHGLTDLQDEAITYCGLKIYGSPWQPRFFDWAFNVDRGPALKKIWAKIPDDTDVLVTHGPPLNILDQTIRGEAVGCADLAERVKKIKPKCHIFGHIHEAYGEKVTAGTHYINASICTLQYVPSNPPVELELPEVVG